MIDAAHHQQRSYNQHVQQRSFQVGDTVWLDLLTAGKLDPKWEGDGEWEGGGKCNNTKIDHYYYCIY